MIKISWILKKNSYNVASERIRYFNLLPYFKNYNSFDIKTYSKINIFQKDDILVFLKKYDKGALKIAKKNQSSIIILDLCDFDFYNNLNNTIKIKEFLKYTSYVTCPTEKLKNTIYKQLNFPLNRIHVIHDSFDYFSNKIFYKEKIKDLLNFRLEIKSSLNFINKYRGKTNLLWFGNSKGSYAKSGIYSLIECFNQLNEFNKLSQITLTVISDKIDIDLFNEKLNFPINYIQWNPMSFYKIIGNFDIAFLPIVKNPFNNVKSHNRITTALNNNLHVITNSIESYKEFKDYLILDDYHNSFKSYFSKNKNYKTMIKYDKLIFSKYNKENIAESWINIFHKILHNEQ